MIRKSQKGRRAAAERSGNQAGQRRGERKRRGRREGDEPVSPNLPSSVLHTGYLKSASEYCFLKTEWFPVKRIHVIAGKLVGAFNEPFLVELHNGLLSTDSADAVGQAPREHPTDTVELWGEMHRAALERRAWALLRAQGRHCQPAGRGVLTASLLV